MNLKAAEELLAKIASPEVASALKGAAKEDYLKALEVVHGPIEQRAADLGFDLAKPQYHGTGNDIHNFNISERGTFGPGVYTTPSAKEASIYANKADNGGNVQKVFTRPAGEYFDATKGDITKVPGFKDLSKEQQLDVKYSHEARAEFLKGEGFAGVTETKGKDAYRNTFDPSQVRSANAAFDPRFKNSSNLLAGAAPIAASMNPLEPIGRAVEAYQQHVVEPVRKAFSKQIDMTGGQMESDPIWKSATGAAVDPTNYVPGAAGVGLGAIQAMAPKPQYAEGGGVVPPGAIPVDQFEAADSHSAGVAQQQQAIPPGAIPVDQFESHEDAYGSPGQQAIAGLEGVAHGLAGPLATLAEKHILKVPEADILGRQEENPVTHAVGQGVGLGAGMLTGTGEAAVLGKAGQLAAEAAGLGEAVAGATLGFKVGSAAVSQAAEMAVLQGGDEISKMILNDPATSAESAIANIGLSAALGGAGGAFMTGAVSPLWEATAGPKVEAMLNGMKTHFDGNKVVLPAELMAAKQTLGVEIAPEIQAAMSGNPTAVRNFTILNEGQNKAVGDSIQKLHNDLSESVSQSLGILPEDVAVHDLNAAGHELRAPVRQAVESKYGPLAAKYDEMDAEAGKIFMSDEARLDHYGKMIEQGQSKVGTDSPLFKLYPEWGNRILAKDTVGGLDMLKKELGGEIDKAYRAADTNSLQVLKDIRTSISDLQEQQIMRQASELEAEGHQFAGALGSDLIKERAAISGQYREFAGQMSELADHLGIGRFTGFKGLMQKLDGLSGEQMANKFSFKGNADFIPFLKTHLPEVYEQVRQNELKKLLKPAVLSAKGEQPINIKKLNDIIAKGMAGEKSYIEAVVPPEAIQRIQAAAKLTESIPNPKSSGTAGWMTHMFKDVPRSAMAGVAMMSGHNPLLGGLIGEMAQRLGRDAPDAIRLAHLKFLGSSEPIQANGFKAMVDFFHNTYNGQNALSKATKAVLKSGAQVITANNMPAEADRTKLDKLVTKMQDNPQDFVKTMNGQTGHYLPNHQQALSATSTRALQYLQSIKPQPHTFGPLDKPVPPTPIEVARYNRALDIAQQPSIVLHHIKEGTLQTSDIADLHNMYPGLYKDMSQKLTNAMTAKHSDEEHIPYRTRVGMALFLGAPVDATMTPEAIMAAQPKPQQPQGPAPMPGKNRKGAQSLGKSVKNYMTPSQSAESDRSGRD